MDLKYSEYSGMLHGCCMAIAGMLQRFCKNGFPDMKA